MVHPASGCQCDTAGRAHPAGVGYTGFPRQEDWPRAPGIGKDTVQAIG